MAGKPHKTLLIVDDEKLFGDAVAAHFSNAEFRVVTTHSGQEGLKWCREHQANVVLLDQNLPDAKGIELCKPILAANEQTKIIFITAYPSFDHAVKALRSGACDYLSKPMELEEIELAVERAFRTGELEHLVQIQQFKNHQESKQYPLIGLDGGLRPIRHLIELASSSRAPVLITGETGTGKNVIAKAIHYLHEDSSLAFIGTNCAALPESLIESEFFGHEKGAFTGATAMKKGLFEMADGGTLFLDEIGELPMHLQSKLLGVLDDGNLRRVGGQKVQSVDVRLIAATNVHLEKAVKIKTFREDLYYRMGVLRIHLPRLQERLEDMAELSQFFIKEIAPDQTLHLPEEELEKLRTYSWPGNVRELKNIIERAIILRKGHIILPSRLLQRESEIAGTISGDSAAFLTPPSQTLKTLAAVEQEHIERVLDSVQENRSQAAKALGIARSTLLRKIDTYGIGKGVLN